MGNLSCPSSLQLLMAINTLTKAGIVHCDLKPNNIMFVSKEHRKIKLIDFGLALMNSRLRPGVVLQATSYRAPEILLGLSFSHGIDMWATGCIFAFLYLCHNLFRAKCGYEKVRQRPESPQPSGDWLKDFFLNFFFFVPTDATGSPAPGSAWGPAAPSRNTHQEILLGGESTWWFSMEAEGQNIFFNVSPTLCVITSSPKKVWEIRVLINIITKYQCFFSPLDTQRVPVKLSW